MTCCNDLFAVDAVLLKARGERDLDIQILVATMNRQDFSFLNKMGLWGNVFVVNQCDRNGYEEFEGDGFSASIMNTTQRGLSKSRNEALLHATGDVYLTADDDVIYTENAAEIIEKAFANNSEADIVAFNMSRVNYKGKGRPKIITKWHEVPTIKYYSSVRLAFRTSSIQKANLFYHQWFGTGSRYCQGEESLFLRQARKAGLKIYACPETIVTVDFSHSTWFEGYTARYFHDVGAWVKCAYPHGYPFIKFYYLRYAFRSSLSLTEVLGALNQGIRDFEREKDKV